MQSLRIQGVVRLADGVRRELSQPITPVRKDQIRQTVGDALRQIDGILASHAADVHALPGPTRRAYEFLKGLDLNAIVPTTADDADVAVPGSIRFPRLQRDVEHQLDRLATTRDASNRLFGSVRFHTIRLTSVSYRGDPSQQQSTLAHLHFPSPVHRRQVDRRVSRRAIKRGRARRIAAGSGTGVPQNS